MSSRFVTKGSSMNDVEGLGARFVFRPSRGAEELKDLLRVRTAAFRNVRGSRIGSGSMGLDVDAFDRFAHHLGLFSIEPGGRERAIGYTRLIAEATSPQLDQLLRVVRADGELYKRIFSARKSPFPSISYFPELREFCEMARRSGEKIAEPSRYSLDPTIHSLRLAQFIAFATTAYAMSIGFANGVMACRPHNVAFYGLLGFSPYSDDSARYVYTIGWEAMPVVRWHSDLDASLKGKIQGFVSQFRKAGNVYLELEPKKVDSRVVQQYLDGALAHCAAS